MFLLYYKIGEAIRDAVKAIHGTDLDKGQLEDPERFNSIVVPGVLIGQSEIQWQQLAARQQIGKGTLTVKTIFRLNAQTHLTDPLLRENLKQLELADLVHEAVLSVPGITTGVTTSDYPSGTFYVVEQTYEFSTKRGPGITYKTVQVQFNPIIHNPTAHA